MATTPTAADHEAYGSTTWIVALENAEQNWTDHNGRAPQTDADEAECADWARYYITSGLSEICESDHLDLIAGTATGN
jgi:hypothetical protein